MSLSTFFGARSLDQRFPSIAAMERAARRRVPKFAHDYMVGGIGAEDGVARNTADFNRVRLMPRYLVDWQPPSLETRILGQKVAAPFGPGPVGLTGIMWPDAVRHVARGAAAHGLPMGMSTVATASLEEIAAIVGPNLWFQLYPMRDPAVEEDVLARFAAVGGQVLLVTVDIPGPTRRARDIANGLSVPPRQDWRTYLQAAARPRWALETLRKGAPAFKTILRYAEAGADRTTTAEFLSNTLGGHNPPERLARFRELWKGKLVIKGLLSLEDVRIAQQIGADGIIVSNHGGRQLDAAPTAIDVLPTISQAVGGKMAILADGGVRTGLDIARLLALGADFVLLGRAMAFSVGAAGAAGPEHALRVLKEELIGTLQQLGCPSLGDLGRHLYEG